MRRYFTVAIESKSRGLDFGFLIDAFLTRYDIVTGVDVEEHTDTPATVYGRLALLEHENAELRLKLAERDEALQRLAFRRTERTGSGATDEEYDELAHTGLVRLALPSDVKL